MDDNFDECAKYYELQFEQERIDRLEEENRNLKEIIVILCKISLGHKIDGVDWEDLKYFLSGERKPI